jgi:hypothetical protein
MTSLEAMLVASCVIVLVPTLAAALRPSALGCPLVTPVCRLIGHAAGTHHLLIHGCRGLNPWASPHVPCSYLAGLGNPRV